MTNKVIATPLFNSRFKKFIKKSPSLGKEITQLEKILLSDPHAGINLGANLYKIKLASESKGSGKSGGFRVITFLVKESNKGYEIFLLTIYNKSEESTITKSIILKLVKKIFSEE